MGKSSGRKGVEPASTTEGSGFTLVPERYVSAIWTSKGNARTWLAILWRDRDNNFRMTHRFRYEEEGGDEDSWYDVVLHAKDEREATEIVAGAADVLLAKDDPEAENEDWQPAEKLFVRSSNQGEILALLRLHGGFDVEEKGAGS